MISLENISTIPQVVRHYGEPRTSVVPRRCRDCPFSHGPRASLSLNWGNPRQNQNRFRASRSHLAVHSTKQSMLRTMLLFGDNAMPALGIVRLTRKNPAAIQSRTKAKSAGRGPNVPPPMWQTAPLAFCQQKIRSAAAGKHPATPGLPSPRRDSSHWIRTENGKL